MKKKDQAPVPASVVEKYWLGKTPYPLLYPGKENLGLIIVNNFPSLGKLTALRFLEWVQENPGGVISLPTGKTPEYFIKWVNHYLKTWHLKETRAELEANGLDPAKKPQLEELHFVQIDEFFPIDPEQSNSFYYYVNRFYIDGFGLNRKKALLIDASRIGIPAGWDITDIFPGFEVDLALRTRQPKSRLEQTQKDVILAVDQWCIEYEQQIRKLGGIGFFLGGIGPDGHIAFNVRGSDHFSTTRLTQTNYETQAAAATDLGGIEISRKRLVITIGLATITSNPDATVIIFAAGEAKAAVIASAVEQAAGNLYPATALQKLPQARFYITGGAARKLKGRQLIQLREQPQPTTEDIEHYIVDCALTNHKRIIDLSEDELKSDPFTRELLLKTGRPAAELTRQVAETLVARIDRGRASLEDKSFLHLGPHHDDIMLGYMPYIYHLVRPDNNRHTFAYATSGFTAVTNQYVLEMLQKLQHCLCSAEFMSLNKQGYFRPDFQRGKDRDVYQYLDGVAAHSRSMRDEGEARRLLRNLIILLEESSFGQLSNRVNEMIQYCTTQYPGKKDLGYIQRLKGMIREWEADVLWASLGFSGQAVRHLRMGFYKGDIFTELPRIHRDVMPIYNLLEECAPDVVSLALDPEGSGPDTHYKVLQATAEALRMYSEEKTAVDVIGYRNVWFRFHPSEANVYVPVSLHSLAMLEKAFMSSFGSQKQASFPSYEYDGPFYGLAQQIMVEQYQMLKTCLGRDFFYTHDSPRVRAAHGMVFLRSMQLPEFLKLSEQLQKYAEEAQEQVPQQPV